MSDLKIGGQTVDREAALKYASAYLTAGEGWGYPSYDGFDRAGALGPLVDGDFLAPVLLNVSWVRITTYEALQAARPVLQEVLERIPPPLALVDATEDDFARLGELFAVLDGGGIKGARGTVLSKVLHRKRPAFIPLYDDRVRRVYQVGDDAPLPMVRRRSWRKFEPAFARAMREDLKRELPFWQEVAALAPGPPITPLRALDIVAWWAGGSPRAVPAER